MQILELDGIAISGICACLPPRSEDNFRRCLEVYGDEAKARSVVNATGIRSRRVLDAGVTALDLSVKAAQRVLEATDTAAAEIGALVYVTFTPDRQMPCNACMAQARLGLDNHLIAFDLNLACSGWLYGVYVAGLIAKSTGRKVLLLDGDTQTAHLDPQDEATVPLLSDAGTATLVGSAASAPPLRFSFLADGAKGEALRLPFGGTLAMDGFAVFKFVTVDALHFIRQFLETLGKGAGDFDAFVPHQANLFMVEKMAKGLGFAADRLKKSGDVLGNSSSASVPTTIAYAGARGTLLAAGFGGGLSAAVAELPIGGDCQLSAFDY